MRGAGIVALVAVGMATAWMSGCRVEKHSNGDDKDVNISTPFGGMQVKTNDADVGRAIGLPMYPGAVSAKNDNDHDSANVNMSFGSFQLRVKAANYRTGDAPEKVEAFYRDGLKQFGDVIVCQDNHAVGTPAKTSEGLTCDNEKENHITVEDNPSKHKIELKAGSKKHQHIVAIDPEGSGTKFGLVALDLPGNFSDSGDGEDKQ